MTKCDCCEYRYSWDCDDGLPYPDNGCESFSFDIDVLDEEETKMLTKMYTGSTLMKELLEKENY